MSRVSSETVLNTLNRCHGGKFYSRVVAYCHRKLTRSAATSKTKRASFLLAIILCSEISISLFSPVTKSIRLIPSCPMSWDSPGGDSKTISRYLKPASSLRDFQFLSAVSLLTINTITPLFTDVITIEKVALPKIQDLSCYLIKDYREIKYLLPKMFTQAQRAPPACITQTLPSEIFLRNQYTSLYSIILIFFIISCLNITYKYGILYSVIVQFNICTFLEKGKPSEKMGRKANWPKDASGITAYMVAGLPEGVKMPLGEVIPGGIFFVCPLFKTFKKFFAEKFDGKTVYLPLNRFENQKKGK